jgi:AcrR family transcriptional regulator
MLRVRQIMLLMTARIRTAVPRDKMTHGCSFAHFVIAQHHFVIHTMARPKSAHHDIKRDEILDAAAACFAQTGFAAASMQDIANAVCASKARLYHYYDSKQALLFDLLDRYTQGLLVIVAQTDAHAQRQNLSDKAALHELITRFLVEYENSASRHRALLNDTPFLPDEQRDIILNRQRDVVSAFTRSLRRAYPKGVTTANQTAVTMMLFGMINWTFTWLKRGGPMGYADFAKHVIAMLESGLSENF